MSRNGRLRAEAKGLGWASIGIGLMELAAPKQVQQLMGIEDRPVNRGVLRALGVRELMHGFGILAGGNGSRARLATAVWSRVLGDALDTALLGAAATKTKTPARFASVALSVMAIGVMDALCATKLSTRKRAGRA